MLSQKNESASKERTMEDGRWTMEDGMCSLRERQIFNIREY